MPVQDDLSLLIDAARSGRLSRQEIYVRGASLGLSKPVRLALARVVPSHESPLKLWRDQAITADAPLVLHRPREAVEPEGCWQ